jgi:hypothetical protein
MRTPALLRALAALSITAATTAGLVTAPTAAPAAPAASAAPPAGRFSATYVDPYAVWGASDARLDAMFAAQHRVGIDTAIVQWTGWFYDDGSVGTTYPASSATRFRTVDTTLPRILASAARNHVRIWLGLGLRYDLFDAAATRASTTEFAHEAAADRTLAADLLAKYRGRFVGWYVPNEPGYQSITSSSVQRVQTAFLRTLTTGLATLPQRLPTMISPCVPRATEGGLSGTEFVQRLEPMMRDAGIDVWNLQDGHAMTSWSPTQDLAMLRAGKAAAARAHASVWATLYTPGPGAAGTMTTSGLFADLDAIRAAGVPVTSWTFESAFDAGATKSGSDTRAATYRAYAAHIGVRL